jgi:hypothetical protein
MKKVTLTAECLSINANAKGSNVSFVVKADKQPAPVPGQRPQIIARRAVTINFDDTTAKQFEPGKKYKISVEDGE